MKCFLYLEAVITLFQDFFFPLIELKFIQIVFVKTAHLNLMLLLLLSRSFCNDSLSILHCFFN